MSQAPIFNASSRLLNELSGTVPDVSGAMNDYFQEMTFGTITKTVVNFQAVEKVTNIVFQGIWMPYQPKNLDIKSEAQWDWSWYHCFAQINLNLNPDDLITYLGVQYRVMGLTDYSPFGYWEYRLVQDFMGEP